MSIQALQLVGIRIDNLQRLVVLPVPGTVPRGLHVTLAATFRATELTVACHHLVGTRHLIVALCFCLAEWDGQQ